MTRARAVTLTRAAVILGAVLLVEMLCRLGVIDHLTMIAPSEMAASLGRLILSGAIDADMEATFSTVAIALALAILIGFTLGVVVHALPRLRRALDPLLASYYSVPTFVFYPLFVAIFGLNEVPLIVLGIAFGVPAMMMATLNGFDRVPKVLIKTARIHRLGFARTVVLIVLPSAVPFLFTGVKLALAYAFIGIIAGEFILANSGLGHSISYAYDGFDNRTMYALMLFVLIVVMAINLGLHLWEARLMRRRTRA